MIEYEQQLAIHKACGWTKEFPDGGRLLLPYKWYNPTTKTYLLEMPDYLYDLNAMREVEKLLPDRQWSDALMRVIQDTENCGAVEARYKTAKATAAQRAEAYLRTIGKWKD